MDDYGSGILDLSLKILRSSPDPKSGTAQPDPLEVQSTEAALMHVQALMDEVPC